MLSCVALDYGGTLTDPQAAVQPHIGMRPVTPAAAHVIRALHQRGLRLVLASNTDLTRRWALEQAGVLGLFHDLVESHEIGHAKPDPEFYATVLGAAGCPVGQVLFVGNHPVRDVQAPLTHGMHAALVGPIEQTHGLPKEAHHLPDLTGLPRLVDQMRKATA